MSTRENNFSIHKLVCLFDIERGIDGKYVRKEGKAGELMAALKNSNNSYGLFVSKLALLGNKDAIEAVDWFKNILLPGAVPKDKDNNPAGRDTIHFLYT